MKFLFVSQSGANLSLASRIAAEGHKVVFAATGNIGSGIVDCTSADTNISDLVYECAPDLVIFDNPEHGKTADSLRASGFRTALTSNWSALLDSSKSYNANVLNALGFKLHTSEVGHDVTVEGWFNGSDFLVTVVGILYTKFLAGNIGPEVPCMGSVIRGRFDRGKLYSETVGRLALPLRRAGYRGPVSVDLVVNSSGVYARRICAKPRPATTYNMFEGTKNSVADILFATATGEGIKNIHMDDWTVSVTLSVPPFPYDGVVTRQQPIKFSGINDMNAKHIWLVDVCIADGGYCCHRNTGYIGSVTARGKTIRESRRRVYRTISNLSVPELQYRSDIGKEAPAVFKDLGDWGWL